MKKVVVLLFLVLGIINVSYAQEQQIEVTGIVTDANKEPLIGANIVVKNINGTPILVKNLADVHESCLPRCDD